MTIIKSILILALMTVFAIKNANSDDENFLCTTNNKNNVREMPNTRSPRVAVLTKHSPIQIISKDKNWYKVKGFRYTHFSGWIHESIVTNDFTCMLIRRNPITLCGESMSKREFTMHEGFKVLKKEIACNVVEDRFGKKIMINSLKAWPKSVIKLITF
jgi:SH3-like domain-containing protein